MNVEYRGFRKEMGYFGSSDRREFSRVNLGMKVTFRRDSGAEWNGKLMDLSASGIQASGIDAPRSSESGEIIITLGSPPGVLAIRARGRVVRGSRERVVLTFEELLGLDSLENLRHLVLVNALDPDLVEEEFAAHIGLRKRN